MIILSLGNGAYSEEMGVPEAWLYEVVKARYPKFPEVVPAVWK